MKLDIRTPHDVADYFGSDSEDGGLTDAQIEDLVENEIPFK